MSFWCLFDVSLMSLWCLFDVSLMSLWSPFVTSIAFMSLLCLDVSFVSWCLCDVSCWWLRVCLQRENLSHKSGERRHLSPSSLSNRLVCVGVCARENRWERQDERKKSRERTRTKERRKEGGKKEEEREKVQLSSQILLLWSFVCPVSLFLLPEDMCEIIIVWETKREMAGGREREEEKISSHK